MAWYQELFENYAKQYDTENFVQNTESEVDFIEAVLAHDRSRRILDIGCGTGRHSIELASRGYLVTGVDLSRGQLRRAREKAAQRNVRLTFEEGDARRLPFADAATKELPLGRLLRLSLFQISVGMAMVLLTGTLNRVMIVELGVPAWLVGLMVSLPIVIAPFREIGRAHV